MTMGLTVLIQTDSMSICIITMDMHTGIAGTQSIITKIADTKQRPHSTWTF